MTDETEKKDFQKTRAELMKENAQLRAQLDTQVPTTTPAPDEAVAAMQAELEELRSLQAHNAGWLITSRNVVYDGVTHGVKFEAGMAFIPVNRQFPKYRSTPPKEGYKEVMNMKDADWEKMLQRAKRSDAEIVVELITKDMRGYRAEFYDASRQRDLQQRMEARRQEAQAELEQIKTAASAPLTMPGYVGSV